MKRALELSSYFLFMLAGIMAYAYVYDVEPLSAEKHYQLERDAYNRSSDFAYNDFPSFDRWLDDQSERENRMKEWFESVTHQVGVEFADICEWGYNPSKPDPSIPMSAEQWKVAYGD